MYNKNQLEFLANVDNLIVALDGYLKYLSDESIERIAVRLVRDYGIKSEDIRQNLKRSKTIKFAELQFKSIIDLEESVIAFIRSSVNN